MVRKLALALVLLPCLGVPQGLVKSQEKRTRALDVAATTPFFSKPGANAVKRVVAGADQQKENEKVLDPLDAKGATPPAAPALPGQAQPAPGKNQAAPPQPAPEPTFGWRLIGISYGKRQGMALFEGSGKDLSVQSGSTLDSETRIVSITHKVVTLLFHGKRLELTPW